VSSLRYAGRSESQAIRIIVVDSISDKNPLLKQIRRAVFRGTLTEDGYAVTEGVHLLAEARAAGREIGAVLTAESAAERFPEARVISDKTFHEIASTETPQGVIALVRPATWTLEDMLTADISNKDALLVVLDGIQDPGNAGAILRAAEAFGASGAIFLKGTVNPYNPKCLRGSAGSAFRVPLVSGIDTQEFLDHVSLPLYAAMPRASKLASEISLASPCALIIGSEGRGVSPEIQARAVGVRIPTSGVESLNAAVAAGILLYEARRQRVQTA
jgi:RNA methyltransferase, TrmH family